MLTHHVSMDICWPETTESVVRYATRMIQRNDCSRALIEATLSGYLELFGMVAYLAEYSAHQMMQQLATHAREAPDINRANRPIDLIVSPVGVLGLKVFQQELHAKWQSASRPDLFRELIYCLSVEMAARPHDFPSFFRRATRLADPRVLESPIVSTGLYQGAIIGGEYLIIGDAIPASAWRQSDFYNSNNVVLVENGTVLSQVPEGFIITYSTVPALLAGYEVGMIVQLAPTDVIRAAIALA